MTPYELKSQVEALGSHFFDRSTMKFFGDTMRNFGVIPRVLELDGKYVKAYELFRKKPVKHGLKDSAFFDAVTFKQLRKP